MMKKGWVWLFVVILCLAGVAPAKADNDTTPLILKSTSISATELHFGERINIRFVVEEDYESGPFEDADINLRHSSGKEFPSMMRYIGNNTYEFSALADHFIYGDWHVEDIRLYDNAMNSRTYDTSSPLISKLKFRMLDGETTIDTDPPVLTSLNLSKTTAVPGDKVIVTIGYKDASGLSHGSLSLRHIQTDDYPLFSDIRFNSTTGKYQAEITIPKYVRNGTYDVGYVSLTDKKENEISYWAVRDTLLANTKLTISGASSDYTAPVFQEVTLSKTQLYPGDTIDVVVKGYDSGSGIKEAQISFRQKGSENTFNYFWDNLSEGSSNKEWKGTLQVPAHVQEGIYEIKQIYLADQVGNSKFVLDNETLPTVRVLPFYTGVASGSILKGASFDPKAGVRAFSNAEGDRTEDIVMKGTVDSGTNGLYLLSYSVKSNQFPSSNGSGTLYYNSYRWMTVNDQQALDPVYFNENVKIGIPANNPVSLSDGSTVKTISTSTTVTKDGSYQISTGTTQTSSANRLLSLTQKSTLSQNTTEKTLKFVIDRVKPAAPVLNTVYSQSVAVTGKAEAYSTVKVLSNGKYLAQGKADTAGKFSVRIPKQRYGTKISVQATDRAGNVGSASVKTVLYVPGLDPVSNLSTYVTGKSFAKSKIKVYSNGALIKTGYADSAGNYKILIPKQAAGKEMKVVETSVSGKNFTSLPVKVSDKIAPAAPVVNKVTTSSLYVTGTAEKSATILVNVGTKQIASGKATTTGTFKIAIPKQKLGTILTVYAVDASKNKSKPATVKVQ